MFLNPYLLWGAAAISVPIIIHLLNRRRFQRVKWAAMRFIQASLEKNRRRMQIEDLILLALRCLIVALLALALARPVLRAATFLGRSPVTAVILLDNSYSMGKTDGIQTRFDSAKKAADEFLAALPNGSSAAILLVSDTVRPVIPQPTTDLALAREKIRQAPLSDHATNLFPGLQEAYKTLTALSGAQKQVCLITDSQALGWHRGQSTTPSSSQAAGEILRLIQDNKDRIPTRILFMSDLDTRNLAVSNIHLSTELPTVNKTLSFDIEVSNHGDTDARDVPVRLFVDDDPAPVEQAQIDLIPSRAAKSIALHARLRADGYHGITARIAPDTLPTDDSRSAVVHVLKQIQVLLVDGEAGREGREEDTFFVREALQPVPQDLRSNYFIQTRTITAHELDQTSLDSYDALVLANVADLSRPTITALERFLADGRGLIVFTGPNVNAGFYRDVLYRERGILPAALGDAVGDSGQGERFETLQSSRFEHPIMTLWNEEGRGNPASAHFFRMYDLNLDPSRPSLATQPTKENSSTPATPSSPSISPTAIIASFSNNKPAIVEHTFASGRVVLFASTANTQWNDLPVRAGIFIPLMHRVLDSLLQRQDANLNLQVGQKFVTRVPSELLGKDAHITRRANIEGNTPSLPDTVRIEIANDWPEIIYDRTDSSGLYKVEIEGGGEGGGDVLQFAVQPDTAESDLLPLSPQELAQIGQTADITLWKSGSTTQPASASAQIVGAEFWRPLATAVLAFAILETLLAFWFSRVK